MDKDEIRHTVIAHALPHIAFEGWRMHTLETAAREAGLDARDVIRLFPGGPVDALDWFVRYADGHMAEAYAALSPKPTRLRDRISAIVRIRLTAYTTHRETIRRGVALYALPQHMHRGFASLHRTVDAMWHTVGDASTDFNWYTKRATLAAVYSSTLIYWLNDESDAQEATWRFLDRRIENVMQFEKLKAKVRGSLGV